MASMSHQEYIQTKVNPALENLVTAVLGERPENPVPFMIKWLSEQTQAPSSVLAADEAETLRQEIVTLQKDVAALEERLKASEAAKADAEDSEAEDSGGEDIPLPPAKYLQKGPRASVSAEAYGAWNQEQAFTPVVHEKTEEQTERLRAVLSNSFLFSSLDEGEMQVIMGAMVEHTIEEGKRIIQEGEDGEVMYVIEKGSFACLKKLEGREKEVKLCGPGDVFGELALLYNAPRAASVEAKEPGVTWELDRGTFNHIVKAGAKQRRETYDGFLKSVPLLESLGVYERAQLAEALKPEVFAAGSKIITQGEDGDWFYIVQSGDLVATKDGSDVEVMRYKSGDYFGELALLSKPAPRAATITAVSEAKLLSINRKTFTRFLGSLEEIMRRNASEYT